MIKTVLNKMISLYSIYLKGIENEAFYTCYFKKKSKFMTMIMDAGDYPSKKSPDHQLRRIVIMFKRSSYILNIFLQELDYLKYRVFDVRLISKYDEDLDYGDALEDQVLNDNPIILYNDVIKNFYDIRKISNKREISSLLKKTGMFLDRLIMKAI